MDALHPNVERVVFAAISVGRKKLDFCACDHASWAHAIWYQQACALCECPQLRLTPGTLRRPYDIVKIEQYKRIQAIRGL